VPTGKERPAHAIDVALGRVHGSFMWAIRRASDRHTFFFNGPQLGYQAPNTFVELDLKAPGVRLHTGTAPGVPVNSNGYNAHMAWGVTSGLSDDDDLFAVRLAGPERYRFRGRIRRMSCRTERFRYSGGGTMKSTKRPGSSMFMATVESSSLRVGDPLTICWNKFRMLRWSASTSEFFGGSISPTVLTVAFM